jgi:putative ABC transport system substrate-binding protein
MRRREFITLLASGAAATWPLAVRAQQPGVPVVGYLSTGSPEANAHIMAAFLKGLSEMGLIEGRNFAIEYRFAYNDNARLPELAADLVRGRVAVIATPFSAPASLAAKAATATIPIVFYIGADPIQLGLVNSFRLPDANVTGVTSMNLELGAKRLGLLRDLLPRASRFAILVNPTNPSTQVQIKDAQTAASAIRAQIEVFAASKAADIDAAFASVVQKQIDALLVATDNFFNNRRVQLATLAVRHAVPAIYPYREIAEVGGLMSYGASLVEHARQAGIYTGRILKGEKPGDLPVMRAVKFEFVINQQTAKLLGVKFPSALLAVADEVIE